MKWESMLVSRAYPIAVCDGSTVKRMQQQKQRRSPHESQ